MERALTGPANLAFAAPESPSQFTPWLGCYPYRPTGATVR